MEKKNKYPLTEYKYCCGCGLCNNFVEGKYDERGYFRPDQKQLKEKFDTSCCYCNCQDSSVSEQIWGDYKSLYYGYSLNDDVRKKASSGGVITEIACYLLKSKKVDFVIHIKTSDSSPIKSEVAYSATEDDVVKNCGSRYNASSALVDILNKIEKGKKYAVIAKPCDIKVLRNYLNANPELEDTILYLLTFFCGGTPSYQANLKLLSKMKIKEQDLDSFVYRGNGWPGMTTGVCRNGKVSQVEYEESWGQILGRDLQEMCRFCWDGVGSAADISCGDGWYLENGKPSFEENDGRNVIFSRTDKGEKLLAQMQSAGIINLEKETDSTVLIQMQPGQYMRKAAMYSRVLAMRCMGKTVPKYTLKKIRPYSKKLSLKMNFKMFLGTVRRIMQGKID